MGIRRLLFIALLVALIGADSRAAEGDGLAAWCRGRLAAVVGALRSTPAAVRPPEPELAIRLYYSTEVTPELLAVLNRPDAFLDRPVANGFRDAAGSDDPVVVTVRVVTSAGHTFRRVLDPRFIHLGASWLDETTGLIWPPLLPGAGDLSQAVRAIKRMDSGSPRERRARIPTQAEVDELRAHLGGFALVPGVVEPDAIPFFTSVDSHSSNDFSFQYGSLGSLPVGVTSPEGILGSFLGSRSGHFRAVAR